MKKKIKSLSIQMTLLSILIHQPTFAEIQQELNTASQSLRTLTFSAEKQNTTQLDLVFDQIDQLLESLVNEKSVQSLTQLQQDQISQLIHKTTNAFIVLLNNSDKQIQETSLIKMNNLIVQLKKTANQLEQLNSKNISSQLRSDWESTINASLMNLKERLLKQLRSTQLSEANKVRLVELLFDNTFNLMNTKILVNSDDVLMAIDSNNEVINELTKLNDYEKNLIRFFLNNSEDISFTKENLLFLETVKSEYSNKGNQLNLVELSNLMDISAKFATLQSNPTVEKTNAKIISIIKDPSNLDILIKSDSGVKKLMQFIFSLLHQNNLTYSSEALNLLSTVIKATAAQSNETIRLRSIQTFAEQLGLNSNLEVMKSLASHNTNYPYVLKQINANLRTKALPIMRLIEKRDYITESALIHLIESIDTTITQSENKTLQILQLQRRQGSIIIECRNLLSK